MTDQTEQAKPAETSRADLVDALAGLILAHARLKYGAPVANAMAARGWRTPFASAPLERARRALIADREIAAHV